nr:putative laccase [Tanacetum cinerariifolium]
MGGWTRDHYPIANVYGALIIWPKQRDSYPFPKPNRDSVAMLGEGEWWEANPIDVIKEATGGAPNVSDAYTINGQPGDLYKCSIKVGRENHYLQHVDICIRSGMVEVETWCHREGRIEIKRDSIIKDYANGEALGRATRVNYYNEDIKRSKLTP